MIEDRIADLQQQISWLTSRAEPPIEGRFLNTATARGDKLRVQADGYDGGEHAFGDPHGVRWTPLPGDDGLVYPSAGDWCLLVESSEGSWCVLLWTPTEA